MQGYSCRVFVQGCRAGYPCGGGTRKIQSGCVHWIRPDKRPSLPLAGATSWPLGNRLRSMLLIGSLEGIHGSTASGSSINALASESLIP